MFELQPHIVGIWLKINFMAILTLPLIQDEQLSITGENVGS